MRSMDCTDIKVLLSGLIDDELDAQTRHLAERHLAECTDCRNIMNEAEALTGFIALEAEEGGAGALPEGFAGAVLSRTAYAHEVRSSGAAGWVLNPPAWISSTKNA